MSLIAALTGAFGLLSSFLLLRQGVDTMALRYPLALACAYAMFLFLIWLWLRTQASDWVDVPDGIGTLSPGGNAPAPVRAGGGGDFGGGGASASFDGQLPPVGCDASSPVRGIGETIGSVADADEWTVPLVAIVLAAGLALASFYVIYIAPVLFAEVLVDGALSVALYRYLRGDDPAHWLVTAIRRTALPFLATAVFLAVIGALMSAYAPGARSIGEVVHRVPAGK
jgi:hypothetical protein